MFNPPNQSKGKVSPSAAPPSLRDAYFFFLPLILMAEMMMISHPIIHGFLARTDQPIMALAAYNAAFSFHASIGGPIWVTPLVCLGFVQDRASARRLLGFSLWVALIIGTIELLVGITPLGLHLYHGLMRISLETARQAQMVTMVMAWVMPLVVLRHLAQVMMMVHRQTIFVTIGAVVRLTTLALTLPVTLTYLTGAQVGAVAFFAAIAIESLIVACLGIPFYRQLEEKVAEPPSYRDIWHFGWPLMASQTVEWTVNLTINLFLGRLANPDRGVAAFGVVNSLMRLLLSPLRNISQTTQALVRTRDDWPMLMRFTLSVMCLFGVVVAVVFCWPRVNYLILHEVIRLPSVLYNYAAPGLWMPIVIVPFWASAFLLRGLLSATRNTKPIGKASFLRLSAVVLWGFLITTLYPNINGVVFGMATTLISFVVDVVWMSIPLLRHWKKTA